MAMNREEMMERKAIVALRTKHRLDVALFFNQKRSRELDPFNHILPLRLRLNECRVTMIASSGGK